MVKDHKSIQLIFCVECCSSSKTDSDYIRKLLKLFYSIDQYFKDSYVYLNGKDSYCKLRIAKLIADKKKKWSGDTIVIYCIDTDTLHIENDSTLNAIKAFCESRDYKLILFVKEIENVVWNRKVRNNEKTDLSIQFVKTQHSNISIDPKRLSIEVPHLFGESNFMTIIDAYLNRKQK